MQLVKKYLLPVWLTMLTVFSANSQNNNWEYKWLRSLADKRTQPGNDFHKTLSKINGTVCLAVPAGMFITGLIEKNKTLKENAFFITESIVLSSVITWSLKKTVGRDRPAVNDPTFTAVLDLHNNSFPSGHTSEAFSMATSLSMKYHKWYVVVPAFAYAGLSGYSRLYLGVHYPTDVLAGALVGSGSAWIACKLNQWLQRDKRKKQVLPVNH
jgi:undecaprenyl-diphosphatase